MGIFLVGYIIYIYSQRGFLLVGYISYIYSFFKNGVFLPFGTHRETPAGAMFLLDDGVRVVGHLIVP